MYLSPPSSCYQLVKPNCVFSSFPDLAIQPVASATKLLLPMLPKLPKHSQHYEWVWVVFGYKSPLNGYNNGRGKEKRLQRFSPRMSSFLSNTFLSIGFLLIFVGNEGIYSMSDGNTKSHNFQ